MESVLARPCGIHACLHSGHVALSKLSFLARGLSFQFPFRFPVMVRDFFSTTLLHDLQPNYTLYPPKVKYFLYPLPQKFHCIFVQ